MSSAGVLTNLYGGLGNQLFQFAATLHVMRELKLTTFDLLLLEGHRDGPTIGDFTDLPIRRPTRMDRASWTEFAQERSPLNPVFRRTARINEARTRRQLVKQPSPFAGVPALIPGRPVKLEGFFQNPDWFAESWESVVPHLLSRAPAGFEALAARRRWVVHFRRGDYVRSHWDMPPSYYLGAIEALGMEGGEIVIVGDEPGFVPWMAEILRPLRCTVGAVESLSDSAPMNDFWNVAAASRIVLANSTFSWWAAAVASVRDPDVRIAYPRPWIINRWAPVPPPDYGLPGWRPFVSGLPAHT